MPNPQRYSPRQLAYLEAMGIPAWEQRVSNSDAGAVAGASQAAEVRKLAPASPAAREIATPAATVTAAADLPPTDTPQAQATDAIDSTPAIKTAVADAAPSESGSRQQVAAAGIPPQGFPDWLVVQPLRRMQPDAAAADDLAAGSAMTSPLCIVLDTWSDPQHIALDAAELELLTAMLRAIKISMSAVPIFVPVLNSAIAAAANAGDAVQSSALSGGSLLSDCCRENTIVLVLVLAADNPAQQAGPVAKLRQYQGAALAGGRKVYLTCHPRLLLQQPALKRDAWNDLQQLQSALAHLQSQGQAGAAR